MVVSVESRGAYRVARCDPQVPVDVFEREPAGEHEHLQVVQQLGDLLGRSLRRLVLGRHPRLGRLLDDLLADGGPRMPTASTVPDAAGRDSTFAASSAHKASKVFRPAPALQLPHADRLSGEGRREPRLCGLVALVLADPGAGPHRSIACCSASQVRRPKPTGTPVSVATEVRAVGGGLADILEVRCAPLITTPEGDHRVVARPGQTRAATGSSNVPGP